MRSLLLAAAFVAFASPALAQTAFPDDAKLLEMIKARVEDGRAAGLVVGVMEKDGSTRIVSFGDAGPGARPLGADSIFEIGSISKVFTSTILADMVKKGEVGLDVPGQTYAPVGLVLPKRNGKEITLGNLSEQNSGLPRMPDNFRPANFENPYADYTTAQLDDFVGHYELPRDIGEKFEYSNLGVGILGNLLANKAGKPYETLVQERVIKPLGMNRTGITLTPDMQAALAKGHTAQGAVTSLWDIPAMQGAGAIRSSMTDMLKFLDANVGEPKNDLERAMRFAQEPRFTVSANTQIGLNWLTLKTKSGVAITWHDGGTGGYATFIGFDQTRGVGVVVLSNQSGVIDDIGLHLLDPATPLTPKPPAPKPHVEITLPAETLAKYTGVYAMDSTPTFQITVTVENGGLVIQATGQGKLPVYPEAEAEFFAKALDAQFSFAEATPDAKAYLTLHQNGANMKATKLP